MQSYMLQCLNNNVPFSALWHLIEDVCRYSAPQTYDRLNSILLLEITQSQHFQLWVSTDSTKLVTEFFKLVAFRNIPWKVKEALSDCRKKACILESSTHSTEKFNLRRMSQCLEHKTEWKAPNSVIPRNYHLALKVVIYLWNFLTILASKQNPSSCLLAAAHSDVSDPTMHLYISYCVSLSFGFSVTLLL